MHDEEISFTKQMNLLEKQGLLFGGRQLEAGFSRTRIIKLVNVLRVSGHLCLPVWPTPSLLAEGASLIDALASVATDITKSVFLQIHCALLAIVGHAAALSVAPLIQCSVAVHTSSRRHAWSENRSRTMR